MWKNIIYIFIFLNIINQILSDDISYVLSNTGNKGVAITSFSKHLYLLSSTYIYNIINENYNSIKNNINSNPSQNPFYKNFEMLEASINIYTNESVFLIAEHSVSTNKINLYSFNITSSRNSQNPKLIYRTNSVFENARISLINVGNDEYLLSYIINDDTFESVWFEYTYYEGFNIIKTFTITISNAKIITGMSCFLLYDQFPICFYSTQNTNSPLVFNLNLVVFDIVFVRYELYNRPQLYYIISILNTLNNIEFTKAIYLYKDNAVFCYMEAGELKCVIKYLNLNFETFILTSNGNPTTIYSNTLMVCANDINKIDIMKIDNLKFIVACVNNANDKILIDLIEVTDISDPATFFSLIATTDHFELSFNVKSTLTLFLHQVYIENNYYGVIFDDNSDNKVKYSYLNLPYCSKISSANFPHNIILPEDNATPTPNTFSLSDYFEIKIENNKLGQVETNYVKYKILLYSAKDDDNNIFSHEIKKSSTNILVGDIVTNSDVLTINPLEEENIILVNITLN